MSTINDPRFPRDQAPEEARPQVVQEEIIPLAEETLSVRKQTVETGKVRVRTVLQERQEIAQADIFRHAVLVERVPIDREIDEVPAPWEDGDVLVVPIVEEILVVEKRLMLREELRVHRRREVEHVEQPITLRSTEALIERQSLTKAAGTGEVKPR